MKRYHQFLPAKIQSLRDTMVVVGRAMTVLEADAFEELSNGNNPIMKKPFGLMLEALDDLKKMRYTFVPGHLQAMHSRGS